MLKKYSYTKAEIDADHARQERITDAEVDAVIAKHNTLQKMYPNIGVLISCCSPEELNTVVSTHRMIVLNNTKNCYCFGDNHRPGDFIEVKRKGQHITNRNIFEALDKIRYSSECGHCFFEGIRPIAKSEIQFEMILGS